MTSFTKEKTGLSYNRTYKYVSILGLKFIGKGSYSMYNQNTLFLVGFQDIQMEQSHYAIS